MELHEWMSSSTARGGRFTGKAQGQYGPASGRVVDFDAAGQITAIGEPEEMIPHTAARGPGEGAMRGIDLGPLRGGQAGAAGFGRARRRRTTRPAASPQNLPRSPRSR